MTKKKLDYLGASNEVRITGVTPDLKEDLINISKNIGISLSSLLKPKLRDIANSYPDGMKKKREF